MVDYPGNPAFSISQNGVLAYHSISGPRSQLAWLDRAGTTLRTIAVSDVYSHVNLSQDGNQAAFERPDSKSRLNTLWLVDVARGTSSRFSDDAFSNGVPVWSPNGDRIVFNSVREGSRNLYWKSVGGGAEELLFKSGESLVPSDWSADGQFILSTRRMSAIASGISGPCRCRETASHFP